MINFTIISIFPNAFSYLGESMLYRAARNKKIKIKILNPRDFSKDKHKKVDGRPYGGGPGMVMTIDPIVRAWQKAGGEKKGSKTILLSPRGKQFDNKKAKAFSKSKNLILIAGHYEGVDARIKKITKAKEISIGSYILSGGELPAMVIIDVVARQIKGVLGKMESLEEKRVASGEVYTRPEIYKYKDKNRKVPKVLLSGHHSNIEKWKKAKN